MKILKICLKLFLVLLILFIIAASVYVKMYGKSFLESALNSALKRNVVLGSASYQFPLGIRANNIQIAKSVEGGDFLKVKRIVAQLSPVGIAQGKLAFSKVLFVEPSLVLEGKKKSESINMEQAPRQGVVVPPVQKDAKEAKDTKGPVDNQKRKTSVEISITRLITRQGQVQYTEALTEEGFSFKLEDVQLKARKLVFPVQEGRSEFRMSAVLVQEGNPLSGSNVQASGWVDVAKKDMQAKLEVVESDGMVGLTAEAVSKNNDMKVNGEVKVKNLFQGIEPKASPEQSSINGLIRNALSSAGVEIGAKFNFNTKMDNFRVGQVSFSGSVVTK